MDGGSSRKQNQRILANEFFEDIKDCKPLVFKLSSENPGSRVDVPKYDGSEFDMPFDCISIEMLSMKKGVPTYLSLSRPGLPMMLNTFLVIYNEPKRVLYFGMQMAIPGHGAMDRVIKLPEMDLYTNERLKEFGGVEGMVDYCKSLILEFTNRLNSEVVGRKKLDRTIKTLTRTGYGTLNISDVIFVAGNKGDMDIINSQSEDGNKIDYSHRFFRRGHWMKQDPEFIGKDRHGVRNQKGRTWRVEAEVGDKSLPLINKTGVVLNAPQA